MKRKRGRVGEETERREGGRWGSVEGEGGRSSFIRQRKEAGRISNHPEGNKPNNHLGLSPLEDKEAGRRDEIKGGGDGGGWSIGG